MKNHHFRLACIVAILLMAPVIRLNAAGDINRKAGKAAEGVITRTLGYFPKKLSLEVTGPIQSGEYFSTEVVKRWISFTHQPAMRSGTVSIHR